jgi:hypothetical protein
MNTIRTIDALGIVQASEEIYKVVAVDKSGRENVKIVEIYDSSDKS